MLYRAKFTNCQFSKHSQIFSEFSTSFRDVEFHGLVYLGFGSYMGSGYIKGKALIKRYCSIGKNVKLGLAKHPVSNFSTHPMLSHSGIVQNDFKEDFVTHHDYDANPRFKVVIENDVWIGDDCMVLQGVHIGQGAVVGANSVVTKNVPPYAIAVGSPARVIKYRFDEETVQQLLQSRWCDIHPERLIEIGKQAQTIEDFLKVVQGAEKHFLENYLEINLQDYKATSDLLCS